MDPEAQSGTELEILRTLCNEATPREERLKHMQSLSQRSFIEPEHQVVFESIRSLFSRGPVSVEQLRIHLNNRGFPDTDVETYFHPETCTRVEQRSKDKATP